MKKSKKLLIIIAGMLVLSSCTVAPLTGRRQLKLVSDESVVDSSVSQYRQFINEANNKGLVVNNTPDGRRLKNIGNRMATAVETYLRENGLAKKVDSVIYSLAQKLEAQ